MERLRSIDHIHADLPDALNLVWSDNTRVTLHLAPLLKRKSYRQLKDSLLFRRAKLGEWGHSIVWPDGTEIGADSLWRMSLKALGKENTLEFLDWRMRNGLSLSAAAQALGISRRMVAYYSSGERPVSRTILLACKGWEAEVA